MDTMRSLDVYCSNGDRVAALLSLHISAEYSGPIWVLTLGGCRMFAAHCNHS